VKTLTLITEFLNFVQSEETNFSFGPLLETKDLSIMTFLLKKFNFLQNLIFKIKITLNNFL